MDEAAKANRESEVLKINMLKATAVKQAMIELIGENREEIIRRAHAKLVAMGIEVKESDLGAQLS